MHKEAAQRCIDYVATIDPENKWQRSLWVFGSDCWHPVFMLPNPDYDEEYSASVDDMQSEKDSRAFKYSKVYMQPMCTDAQFQDFLAKEFPEVQR